jgi:hypothetical protein
MSVDSLTLCFSFSETSIKASVGLIAFSNSKSLLSIQYVEFHRVTTSMSFLGSLPCWRSMLSNLLFAFAHLLKSDTMLLTFPSVACNVFSEFPTIKFRVCA